LAFLSPFVPRLAYLHQEGVISIIAIMSTMEMEIAGMPKAIIVNRFIGILVKIFKSIMNVRHTNEAVIARLHLILKLKYYITSLSGKRKFERWLANG
jgi:hypothetical protein